MRGLWRQQRGLIAVMLAGLLLFTQVLLAWKLASERLAATEAVDSLRREWEALVRLSPTPTPGSLAALSARRAILEAEVDEVVVRLERTPSDLVRREPPGPEQLYFAVADFIERMQDAAEEANVQVDPDEAFSFQRFTQANRIVLPSGEETVAGREAMVTIDFQLRALEMMLTRLFAAGPRSVRKTEREPATPNDQAASADSLFRLAPGLSVAVPERVRTTAFRLTFTGQTAVLRDFLQGIAEVDERVVVRGIEVAPIENISAKASARDAARRSPSPRQSARSESPFTVFDPSGNSDSPQLQALDAVPLVAANESVFTVTLEVFDLAARGAAL